MPEYEEPTGQPLSKLPVIAFAIRGMREGADEMHQIVLEAQPKPYVLDDATVARLIRVHTEQRNDLWLYDEQLRRWRAQRLTDAQAEEIGRLESDMRHLRSTLDAILSIADELKDHTIERTLAKTDLELGLDVLVRQARRPGP